MADLTSDIDTGGLGDYASIDAFDTGEGQDLTDDGGDTMTASCRASGDTADTTAVILDNWTTASGNELTIDAAADEEALITGYAEDRYRLEVTEATPLEINEDYVIVEGLQIKTITSGFGIEVSGVSDGANLTQVYGCRIDCGGTYVVRVNSSYSVSKWWNDIVLNGNDGFKMSCNTAKIYNCIVYGASGDGIEMDGGTFTVKNTASFNNGDNIADDVGGSTIEYCATDDDEGDTNGNIHGLNWANEFVNAAGGDFTLKTGGSLEGAGIGPGSDGEVPTTDIDGTTRSGATCDIGADEYEAVGGGSIVPLMQLQRRLRN